MINIKKNALLLSLGLFLSLSGVSGLVASDFSQKLSDKELCDRLYAGYEQLGDGLVSQLSAVTGASVGQCVKVLEDDQKKLTDQINALSYKNIIFSGKTAKNALIGIGSAAGLMIADTFMHNKLADTTATIAEELADYMHNSAAF